MSHEYSMLGIMNAALTAVGLDEIVSENDGTPEYRAMLRNWPGIVEGELELGRYEFTRVEFHLQSRIDGKFNKDDGYLIPGDALHVRRLWLKGNIDTDWSSDGTAVYLDGAVGCYVECLVTPDASIWSATFAKGVQCSLEAVLYRMTSDMSAAREADLRAVEKFDQARTVSSKSRSARPVVRASSFAEARFNGGY